MIDKVDRLVEQEAALAAKLKSTREERLREEARLASHRAELVGKVVLKQVKEGKLEDTWLRDLLCENLSRKADRRLFDLECDAKNENALEPNYSDQSRATDNQSEPDDSPNDALEPDPPTALLGR